MKPFGINKRILGVSLFGIALLCGLICFSMASLLFQAPKSNLCQDERITPSDELVNVIWQQQVEHGIAHPPVVNSNTVIVIDRQIDSSEGLWGPTFKTVRGDKIVALDSTSGKLQWTIEPSQFSSKKQFVSEQAANDKYYAVATQGEGAFDDHVFVADIKSGQIILNIPVISSEMALSDRFLFTRGPEGNLYAYDLRSGRETWRVISGARGSRGLLYTSGFLYELLGVGAKIEKYAAGTGAHVASILPTVWNSEITSENILENVDVMDYSLFAAQYTNGEVALYSLELPPDFVPDIHSRWLPTFEGDAISMFDQDSKLYVFSKSGVQTFTMGTGQKIASSPTTSHGKVFFITSDGSLKYFNEASFTTMLQSSVIRYSDNIPGGYFDHYTPGIAVFSDSLFVSFGCRTVLAVQEK